MSALAQPLLSLRTHHNLRKIRSFFAKKCGRPHLKTPPLIRKTSAQNCQKLTLSVETRHNFRNFHGRIWSPLTADVDLKSNNVVPKINARDKRLHGAKYYLALLSLLFCRCCSSNFPPRTPLGITLNHHVLSFFELPLPLIQFLTERVTTEPLGSTAATFDKRFCLMCGRFQGQTVLRLCFQHPCK